jgi:hypothetical protein
VPAKIGINAGNRSNCDDRHKPCGAGSRPTDECAGFSAHEPKEQQMTKPEMIRELTADEAQMVAAGSIWSVLSHYVAVHQWVSPLDTHSLNPQQLLSGPQAVRQIMV